MNVNSEAKRILIFGDSISWGFIPGSNRQRFAPDIRWPGKLQQLLGGEYEIIEENLNSRAIEHGDPRPGKEGRRALDYIEPCLDSHDPIDRIIVLLGTNELKCEFNMSAEDVGSAMEKLLTVIINRPSQCRDTKPKITILSPPIAKEMTEYCKSNHKYLGANEKSKKLADIYCQLAIKLGVDFISLEDIEAGVDGIHIDANEQDKLARLVYSHLSI